MTAVDKGAPDNKGQTAGDLQTVGSVVQTNAITDVVAAGPRRRKKLPKPSLTWEKRLWADGHRYVAGVDEVGRGAWAGPLTVGVAVLAPPPCRTPSGLRDSKLLLEDVRERLFAPVGRWCTSWAVGHAGPEECDDLGMTACLRLATRRAFACLPPEFLPDAVVLDGNFDYVTPKEAPSLFDEPAAALDGWAPRVQTVIKADAKCSSVAAASVLAKVTRDRLMRADAESYPPFEFDRNKGYPSPTHKRALRGYGLTAIHRRSWVFVDDLPWR
ncbi:MAG: ribonuclease HII [Acidimicrobiales bacterium]